MNEVEVFYRFLNGIHNENGINQLIQEPEMYVRQQYFLQNFQHRIFSFILIFIFTLDFRSLIL